MAACSSRLRWPSALLARHSRAQRSWIASASGGSFLENLKEEEIEARIKKGDPFVLLCGARWCSRSEQLSKQLAEWSSQGRGGGLESPMASVACGQAFIEALPNFLEKRNIISVPTVLLVHKGIEERRADGADADALESVLKAAAVYNVDPAVTEALETGPAVAITQAEEWLRLSPDNVGAAKPLFQSALAALENQGNAAEGPPAPFTFRARLGLLRCALHSAMGQYDAREDGRFPSEAEVEEVTGLLAALHEYHLHELSESHVDDTDTLGISRFLAGVRLLISSWEAGSKTPAAEVLRHYAIAWQYELAGIRALLAKDPDLRAAEGQFELSFRELEQGLSVAIQWYKVEAEEDMEGLMASYCSPTRPYPDAPELVVSNSVWTIDELRYNFDTLRPFEVARTLLGIYLSSLGSEHPHTGWARAELALLLDRKKHVPFYTRRTYVRRGGAPELGRSSGRTSGYQHRYWIAWGTGTTYPNTKPIGGPHTADGKHSFM